MTTYANFYGYSDVYPYEIIATSKSGKQITLRAMRAEEDPTWKPELHAGGFLAHCSNQNEQRWIITSNENGHTMKAYLRKDGRFHSVWGKHKIEDQPRRFHDYNF